MSYNVIRWTQKEETAGLLAVVNRIHRVQATICRRNRYSKMIFSHFVPILNELKSYLVHKFIVNKNSGD